MYVYLFSTSTGPPGALTLTSTPPYVSHTFTSYRIHTLHKRLNGINEKFLAGCAKQTHPHFANPSKSATQRQSTGFCMSSLFSELPHPRFTIKKKTIYINVSLDNPKPPKPKPKPKPTSKEKKGNPSTHSHGFPTSDAFESPPCRFSPFCLPRGLPLRSFSTRWELMSICAMIISTSLALPSTRTHATFSLWSLLHSTWEWGVY